jgi:hypothetical protein
MTNAADVSPALAASSKRPCIWFDIAPTELPPDTTFADKVSIALVHLTSTEELDAIRCAGGDGARAKFELAKMAMRGIDGRAIDRSRMEEQEIWEKLGSKGRNIVMAVFEEVWAASKGGVDQARASFRAGSI